MNLKTDSVSSLTKTMFTHDRSDFSEKRGHFQRRLIQQATTQDALEPTPKRNHSLQTVRKALLI